MKIGCILILYNPDIDVLHHSLKYLIEQVDEIFMGDNTPSAPLALKQAPVYPEIIHYQWFEENLGIATAQNAGIKYFIEKNYDYIFFLDQDSIVPPDLISGLVHDAQWLEERGYPMAAIGPLPINRQDHRAYDKERPESGSINGHMVQVGQIMSSASLIPIRNFRTVGLMDANLFIDGVDYEWCWRAKAQAGLRCFISRKYQLDHQLGEGDRFFLYRKVAVSTPMRTYYQYRNYLWLLRRDYVPLKWKVTNGLKYIVKAFYFPLFVAPQKLYARNIRKGILAGFKKAPDSDSVNPTS